MHEEWLRDWVQSETGRAVTACARIGSGASRANWRVDLEDGASLVARIDTGDGPMAGTELHLRREAVLYAALRNTGVRIPRLVAASRDGRALLLERVAGTESFAALRDAAQRSAIVRDYMRCLAELHGLDADSLALEGFARPGAPGDHARLEVALWRRIYQRAPKPDALLAFAFDWLAENAPRDAAATALCHGDAGPGNFLFEGTRVTALLDWEFAHLGDPHDDLAWITVRAQLLGGFGEPGEAFAAWSEAAGRPVQLARIEYYRSLVLLRMAVACTLALGFARARPDVAMDTTVYALLLPYLRFLLPQALGRGGCRGAERAAFEREGERALEAVPALRAHARPLDPLETT